MEAADADKLVDDEEERIDVDVRAGEKPDARDNGLMARRVSSWEDRIIIFFTVGWG